MNPSGGRARLNAFSVFSATSNKGLEQTRSATVTAAAALAAQPRCSAGLSPISTGLPAHGDAHLAAA